MPALCCFVRLDAPRPQFRDKLEKLLSGIVADCTALTLRLLYFEEG
jgi:hypothetical protein